jgi:hypothetical protein
MPGDHLKGGRSMKRSMGILLLPFILSFLAAGVFAAEILTNEAVVTMVKSGLGEDLIVSKIKISQAQFDLSTNGILRLKNEGVGEAIIKAMVEASAPPAPPEAKTAEAMARETHDAVGLYRQGKVGEAVVAFDKLIAEKPGDDGLKIWKALALLEQAREKRDSRASGFKPLVVNAYTILQPLGQRQATNPDWNFAMAKAFWLNDRPTWARKAAGKALDLRPNFAEAHLLLGDLAYDDEVAPKVSTRDPRGDTARWQSTLACRKSYETALAIADLPPDLRAEALYKIGVVSAELENRPAIARDYWQRATATDSASRYGRMAQEKLKAVPSK